MALRLSGSVRRDSQHASTTIAVQAQTGPWIPFASRACNEAFFPSKRPSNGNCKKSYREEVQPAAKRAPSAAFMKPMTPSAALSAVIGDEPMPRTAVTKKVWEYIKENNLQDTVKRTMINPDTKLKLVVGANPISMFGMTREISKHLS